MKIKHATVTKLLLQDTTGLECCVYGLGILCFVGLLFRSSWSSSVRHTSAIKDLQRKTGGVIVISISGAGFPKTLETKL